MESDFCKYCGGYASFKSYVDHGYFVCYKCIHKISEEERISEIKEVCEEVCEKLITKHLKNLEFKEQYFQMTYLSSGEMPIRILVLSSDCNHKFYFSKQHHPETEHPTFCLWCDKCGKKFASVVVEVK